MNLFVICVALQGAISTSTVSSFSWIKGGSVIVGIPRDENEGGIIPARRHVYIVQGTIYRRVHKLADFAGFARITSESEALQLVRTLTSPLSVGLADSPVEVEVVASNQVSSDFYFGNTRVAELIRGLPMDGFSNGLVPADVAAKLHAQASAKKIPSGFQISRIVFRETTLPHGSLYSVTEVVEPDGRYKRLKSVLVESELARGFEFIGER